MGSNSKPCMNALCRGEFLFGEGRKGWPLRSGESAALCDKCGSAYEQSAFCDVFHSEDSGWRVCAFCGKRLHCGCVASSLLYELLDCGGVSCSSCARKSRLHPIVSGDKPTHLGMLNANPDESRSYDGGKHHEGNGVEKSKLTQQGSSIETLITRCSLQQNDLNNLATPLNGEANALDDSVVGELITSITLGGSSGDLKLKPFAEMVLDEQAQSCTLPPSQWGPESWLPLPLPPISAIPSTLDANRGNVSQTRIAFPPPAEGREKSQLLPRYWPKITKQELQQISGDSNSTIIPLFEKVLSASDAGRIGRLVLPKACAEAYFPPLSQSEGLPLRIQDVKGKEWVFQFRFWPNNNSRMYVLEGITPCIQSMQLKAGDTVTFSRMEPDGKFVMGFRKASASAVMQETQLAATTNGNGSMKALFSGSSDNLPSPPQSLKGNLVPVNSSSNHFTSRSGDINWQNAEKSEGHTGAKRTQHIKMNRKRLLINSQESMELKLTWEEAQDLLRPPPGVEPSTVVIDDHSFEEYEDPPIFGKRSIFVTRSSGLPEQWAQCDNCSKWRKLPVDILLPAEWNCADNSYDESRCSCSMPEELGPKEIENLLKQIKESKRQRLAEGSFRHLPDNGSSCGLDALADAAILSDSTGGSAATSKVAATTKHPRHRLGCTCIVCSQPPSGKGKHSSTCICNVCMTVKRRFKTLTMRKNKRGDEIAMEKKNHKITDKADSCRPPSLINGYPTSKSIEIMGEEIDLNCQPAAVKDEGRQNGRTNLMAEQQKSGLELEKPTASVERQHAATC